jgi:hypothetical protein
MAAHAGEKAQEGGMFHCQKCNERFESTKAQRCQSARTAVATHDERTEETSGYCCVTTSLTRKVADIYRET